MSGVLLCAKQNSNTNCKIEGQGIQGCRCARETCGVGQRVVLEQSLGTILGLLGLN